MSDPNHQADLAAHFRKLNMSAQPFVPSASAPVFQPGGGGGNYNQMYGGQYQMGQHPQSSMYPGMPYHMQGMGYGGGYAPQGGGGGVPYLQHQGQQGRPPLHQMNPHSHVEYSPNRGGGNMKNPQPHYQQHHTGVGGGQPQDKQMVNSLPKSNANSTATPPSKPPPTTIQSTEHPDPVDSWEDINITEDKPMTEVTPPTSKIEDTPPTKPDIGTNNEAIESVNSPSTTPSIDTPPDEQCEQATPTTTKSVERKSVASGNNSINEISLPKSAKLQQPVLKKKEDEKENVNIVFIGHVDAGKSTIGGHLMFLTGQVDKRTLDKYEREAREKNRETWYLSWALDTNQEERDKGKTVDVGRGSFETEKKRFTILDAPGHAGFVPNMISGTVQADVGILVISARRGEFETGFERRGQTREHAMLAKTAGVKHLVILVNKMDDPTVGWDEGRYEEIKTKLTPFLKKVGFNPKTDIHYIPVSGLTGANLKIPSTSTCPWYKGLPFLPYLEELPPITREDSGPLRFPIADKHKDMGTIVMGKVESGSVGKGSILIMMPNRSQVEVLSVTRDEEDADAAFSGDNIKLKLKGVEEEDVSSGFVLCPPTSLCHYGRVFDGQMVVLEYKSIICAGFSCVLHIHTVVEVVEILTLIGRIDKKTGKKIPEKPKFIKQDHTAIVRFQTSGVICMETFKDFASMARFTLRDEGKTIAIGKVLRIVE